MNNVQGGTDDCKEYLVSKEQLQSLLDLVDKVLKSSKLVAGKIQNGSTYTKGKEIPNMEDGKYIEDDTVARELLPTTSGFFFGSTNYDQWYYNDLVETKKILEDAIKEDDGDIYYQSSW